MNSQQTLLSHPLRLLLRQRSAARRVAFLPRLSFVSFTSPRINDSMIHGPIVPGTMHIRRKIPMTWTSDRALYLLIERNYDIAYSDPAFDRMTVQ
jgi:hypothetical protein